MPDKIKGLRALAKIVRAEKARGKKISALSGAFDILHPGHISFLERCKKSGDILIVLLNSDKSVRGYKGKGRPINPQAARAKVLSALALVDFISIFNEPDPRKALAVLKPDIFCQGDDWGADCVERETVENAGGKVRVFKKIKGLSTTGIINKIRGIAQEQH